MISRDLQRPDQLLRLRLRERPKVFEDEPVVTVHQTKGPGTKPRPEDHPGLSDLGL